MNLINLLGKQKFNKFLAVKIITAPPFSIEYNHRIFPSIIRKRASKIDESLQQWALAQADFFSESDWRDIQLKKLKNILVHAGHNVFYWRELFKKINFNPEKFKDFNDLKKLPVLTRAEIKKIPIKNLLARNTDRERTMEQFTSSSTGEPLRIFQDEKDLFLRRICTYETYRWMNVSVDAKICIFGLESARNLQGLGMHISMIDMESVKFRKRIYNDFIAYNPRLLIGTPAHLDRVLYFFQKDNISFKIESIIYIGESMNANLRHRLSDFFSSKIFSAYGAREASPLGIDCGNGEQNLHIVPWMNYLEIVEGKIIVTNLWNMVMPFIRYEVGDYGSWRNVNCQCGRQLPIFEVEGRILGNIDLPYGVSYPVNHILAYFTVNYHQEIERMQIEQIGLANLIFRYKPARPSAIIIIEKKGREYFNGILGNKIKVAFEITDYFPSNQNGKIPIFIKKLV